jgi:multisubunit Na+/H+ antiporter MnhC subunit
MNAATLAGLIGAALVGLGLYGLITNPQPLRKILAFNLIGSGVFLLLEARQADSPPIPCRDRARHAPSRTKPPGNGADAE